MRKHISQVASACFFHLRHFRQMRKILSREHRQHLASAVILSRIDYCNARPRWTARLVVAAVTASYECLLPDSSPNSDHETTSLRRCENSWLPIRQCIDFKLGTVMHAIVHGTAPECMCNKVTPVTDLPGRSHLRSAARGLFHVPLIRTRHGSRAFSVAGPIVWNRSTTNHQEHSICHHFQKAIKNTYVQFDLQCMSKVETLSN